MMQARRAGEIRTRIDDKNKINVGFMSGRTRSGVKHFSPLEDERESQINGISHDACASKGFAGQCVTLVVTFEASVRRFD